MRSRIILEPNEIVDNRNCHFVENDNSMQKNDVRTTIWKW